MTKNIKEKLMRLAMTEADKASAEGNYPFGAVVADETGKIFASAHNTQITDHDSTVHAEFNLIRYLSKKHDREEFSSFFLESNAESCSMCFSAAIKAGILHLIFGAPSEPHMEPFLTVKNIVRFCRVNLDISYGVLKEDCIRQIAETRSYQNYIAQ